MSFVVPVLNGEEFIRQCLSSICSQHCADGEYEVIVLDNGSIDKTCEIVESFGLKSQLMKNVNVATLRNNGAKIARGQFVAFIDSDIELSPEFLSQGIEMFGNHEVAACGNFPDIPSNATWVQEAWNVQVCGWRNKTSTVSVPWLGTAVLMVRRENFLAIDGFNENLETAEDVDLCYRLGERGQIMCNPAMKAIHWGEPADLRTFWRKEVWRGIGNIKGIVSHGFRWDELPSIGYPIYCLGVVLFFCFGISFDFWKERILLTPIAIVFLILPAVILAGYTTFLAKDLKQLPQLFFLYFIYGLARAYALVKHFF